MQIEQHSAATAARKVRKHVSSDFLGHVVLERRKISEKKRKHGTGFKYAAQLEELAVFGV